MPGVYKVLLKETVTRAHSLFGDDLVSVVLYGSRARGNARPDSDFDHLIIAVSARRETEAGTGAGHRRGGLRLWLAHPDTFGYAR
ncbi:MAG: nucleotidyltransferase domain-containing protein [Anaerolineae bacterium]|nr:nucleotidyltransferase domain-containing protein [Anaerolineae bacterium]